MGNLAAGSLFVMSLMSVEARVIVLSVNLLPCPVSPQFAHAGPPHTLGHSCSNVHMVTQTHLRTGAGLVLLAIKGCEDCIVAS